MRHEVQRAVVLGEFSAWKPSPLDRGFNLKTVVAHLRGETGLDAAIAAAQLASRQYAKRQRTWLRRRMADWREIALP